LSAQIGANKIVQLPFTHLQAPGGVYSIGVALALVQLAHHTGTTRRDGAINAQLLSGSASPACATPAEAAPTTSHLSNARSACTSPIPAETNTSGISYRTWPDGTTRSGFLPAKQGNMVPVS
jgi:hypothetical protein